MKKQLAHNKYVITSESLRVRLVTEFFGTSIKNEKENRRFKAWLNFCQDIQREHTFKKLIEFLRSDVDLSTKFCITNKYKNYTFEINILKEVYIQYHFRDKYYVTKFRISEVPFSESLF